MRSARGPGGRGVSGAAVVAPFVFEGVCVVVLVVLVMLLVVVVLVVLLWAVLSFGLRFRFRVGPFFGDRFEVEEDLVPEV